MQTKPKSKRRVGNPGIIPGERLRSQCASLPEGAWWLMAALGDGNASEGLRMVIGFWQQCHGAGRPALKPRAKRKAKVDGAP